MLEQLNEKIKEDQREFNARLMPSLPSHICPHCRVIVLGRCPACESRRRQESERRRVRPGHSWYMTERWRQERGEFLLRPENWFCYNPLGRHPERHRVRSETVDHVRPHKGDERLFWSHENWAPCCLSCNSAKAAREEGGFGNPQRHA